MEQLYNFSSINVYIRPDDGSQFESKYVAVDKMINTGVVCDCFDTYTCDLITQAGSLILKLKFKLKCI